MRINVKGWSARKAHLHTTLGSIDHSHPYYAVKCMTSVGQHLEPPVHRAMPQASLSWDYCLTMVDIYYHNGKLFNSK